MHRLLFSCMCILINYMHGFNLGDHLYASRVKDVYLNKDELKTLGKLMPTNKITAISIDGNIIKFNIDGWVKKDQLNIIYFKENSRIISLSFSKLAEPNIIFKSNEDANSTYLPVSVEAYTTDEYLTDNLNELYKKAEELYSDNCSICHALHSKDYYTHTQWTGLFKSMSGRTAIDKQDTFLVTQYLQKHSKDIKPEIKE